MKTHSVTNQAPALVDYGAGESAVIHEALDRAGAGHAAPQIHRVGRLAGSAAAQKLGDLAEKNVPVLHTHDRFGNRIDEVEYDPAYHELMRIAFEEDLHAGAWGNTDPNAHLIRAAKNSVWQIVDAGHGCPVSMSYSAVPALRANPELAATYEPQLISRTYEPGLRHTSMKQGITAGMSMTEKQGGSDVRANTTCPV